MVVICPSLPEDLRQNLLDRLESVFPQAIRNTDSKSQGSDHSFEAIHFSWYNRYSTKVNVNI